MRNYIFSIYLLFCALTASAQASYGDIVFGDYNVKINVSTENDSVFLSLILTSENKKMTDKPKLLLRLTDDTVISLEGTLLESTIKSDGAYIMPMPYVGNIAINENHFITGAKFPITKEQIEQFSKGIKKLRLNTSPKFHEKEWRKDKIGKTLYKKYKESSGNSFEDNF